MPFFLALNRSPLCWLPFACLALRSPCEAVLLPPTDLPPREMAPWKAKVKEHRPLVSQSLDATTLPSSNFAKHTTAAAALLQHRPLKHTHRRLGSQRAAAQGCRDRGRQRHALRALECQTQARPLKALRRGEKRTQSIPRHAMQGSERFATPIPQLPTHPCVLIPRSTASLPSGPQSRSPRCPSRRRAACAWQRCHPARWVEQSGRAGGVARQLLQRGCSLSLSQTAAYRRKCSKVSKGTGNLCRSHLDDHAPGGVGAKVGAVVATSAPLATAPCGCRHQLA